MSLFVSQENFLAQAAKYAQISELSKRVAEWEEKITPKLLEEVSVIASMVFMLIFSLWVYHFRKDSTQSFCGDVQLYTVKCRNRLKDTML